MWESLWSEARVDFGLTHDEFMSLTPRLFAALRKRRSVEHERQEFLLAILNRNVVGFSMAAPKKMPQITDFMPSRWNREESDEEAMIRLIHEMSASATPVRK
jgi:hypothetical protein